MKHILAFGAGVDSTALLAIALNRDKAAELIGISRDQLDEVFPKLDAVVFSDPGAEYPETYKNISIASELCKKENLRFESIRRVDRNGNPTESLTGLMDRLGNIPLLPGGGHVCSMKYKGEVLNKWAEKEYDGTIRWAIGIEANEGHRVKRMKVKKADRHIHKHPLVELNLTRNDCENLLKNLWPTEVVKSSCFYCPFNSEPEIKNLHDNYPELWDQVKKIEAKFEKTSQVKNDLFKKTVAEKGLENATDKSGRALAGMWRKNSYKEGARLYAKSVGGKQLSIQEWEAKFNAA